MKKIMQVLSLGLFAVALVACSAETVEKTFTKTDKEKGNTIVETVKVVGTSDDYLNKTEAKITITFGNKKTASEELKATKKEWESVKKKSTKYVNYKFTEKKNTFEVKEVIDYKEARENEEIVFKSEVFYNSDKYYSVAKVTKSYEDAGFKEVK